jgi:hypothetical protein
MHGFNALPQGKHGSRLSSYILYAASGMRTIPGTAIARERFASVERILAPPQHFNPLAVLQAKKNHPPGRSTTSYLKISIMTNLSLTQEINEFNTLIEMVRSHGTKWAPTQDRLKLASLQSQAEALTTLHDTLSSAYHNLGEVTKKRKQALQSALIQARKIRFSPDGTMTITGIEFYFNLTAPTEKQETVYQFRYVPAQQKWMLTGIQ